MTSSTSETAHASPVVRSFPCHKKYPVPCSICSIPLPTIIIGGRSDTRNAEEIPLLSSAPRIRSSQVAHNSRRIESIVYKYPPIPGLGGFRNQTAHSYPLYSLDQPHNCSRILCSRIRSERKSFPARHRSNIPATTGVSQHE